MESYPEFRRMYEDVYELCRNTERGMSMFSKELLELDRNTVQYMIDEMQDEIDAQKALIREKDEEMQKQIQKKDEEMQKQIEKKDEEIARLKEQLAAVSGSSDSRD